MSAIITDQIRILNAKNFVAGFNTTTKAYYSFVGLPNPTIIDADWNNDPPAPIDNFANENSTWDTIIALKKITSDDAKQVVRKNVWASGRTYDYYRHDYSINNTPKNSNGTSLYSSSYFVLNSDYRVYICLQNGTDPENVNGRPSLDEPRFTDLEPRAAGTSGDGYIWKYLFTVSPSDIVKFDSTEYITLPSDWTTTSDTQVQAVRDSANSNTNLNQIKTVYIDKAGGNYASGLSQEMNIIGDGTGAKVRVDVESGKITKTVVTAGGKDYSYALVDLGSINSNTTGTSAKLIPIIPPSKGHGDDVYLELGSDKVLIYARFDDSTKDFPVDTSFAQVSIVKNPTAVGTNNIFTGATFSGLNSIKFSSITGTPIIGEKIEQSLTNNVGKAYGYVSSYDSETKVLKYIQDRSLYFNQTTLDHQDYVGISTNGRNYAFESSANLITGQSSSFSGSVDLNFSGITTNPTGSKLINLGVNFTSGMSVPEINKGSGQIIYLDNRPSIARNLRQKEDIKIILEF